MPPLPAVPPTTLFDETSLEVIAMLWVFPEYVEPPL